MPRRKTIQPEPFERFDIEDAEVIVIDENTWLIGKGEHKRMAFKAFACIGGKFVFPNKLITKFQINNPAPRGTLTCQLGTPGIAMYC